MLSFPDHHTSSIANKAEKNWYHILMLRKRRPPWAVYKVCLICIVIRWPLTGQRYVDERLQQHVLPIYQTFWNKFLFQEDNAGIPAIWEGTVWKLVMPNPLTGRQGPDPSLIDHPWDSLGWWVHDRTVSQAPRFPNSKTSWLNDGNAFHSGWVGYNPRLLLSMRKRLTECIHIKGDYTRYALQYITL